MDKLIIVLSVPVKSFTVQKYGVYELLYRGKEGEYKAYVSPEEYKVRVLKQKLVFELGVLEKIVEDFEEAVKEYAEKEQSMMNCD